MSTSATYRTLNLRGGDSSGVAKDQNSIRLSARQKNKSQMWERLTFNYLKRYMQKVPNLVATPAFKHKLQTIVGEEVSHFLETSSLTDKSLRELETRLQRILNQEFSTLNSESDTP
jgi:hypothetical protein